MSNPGHTGDKIGTPKDADKLWKGIRYLDTEMDRPDDSDQRVLKVVIKAPQWYGGEYFAVVTADGDDGAPVVAFHTAESLVGLLTGLGNRLRNGSLKWRADEFRGKPR